MPADIACYVFHVSMPRQVSILRFENNNLPVGAKYKEDELFLLQLDLIELLQPRKRNIT